MHRSIPNMTVLSPCDPLEIEQATRAIVEYQGRVYMRKAELIPKRIPDDDYRFEIGKGEIIKPGSDVTIVGCGVTASRALLASKN